MRDLMASALRGSRADYTEIRIEETESTRVSYRGRDLEAAGTTIDRGGVVRCLLRHHGWGIATFNSLDDLPARVAQAAECAAVGRAEEPIGLAPIPVSEDRVPARMDRDFRGQPLAEKQALVRSYNELMLGSDPAIADTRCEYGDRYTLYFLATSDGTWIEEERPSVGIRFVARARKGDDVQTGKWTYALPAGFEVALGREEMALAAARQAVELLTAPTVAAGVYSVVLDPVLAGTFIHEAFGHLSESDFVYENPKAREMMVLGRRFGPDFLNVFDDGSVAGLRGTHRYDDEGTPTRRNDLVRNGVLVGRLHSRQTAAKMGEAVTGNARALSYRYPPIVRMTNTAIENGTVPFAELLAPIKLGVYACDAYGGQTALESFSFSSGHAYMIRDGQIAEPVKDVILAGNLFTTLQNIDAVGNDFSWNIDFGGCGKFNQSPLPTGDGSPHIRIQDVVIGGV